LIEEKLVETINCGGYSKQPFCLYDFTLKTLSHNCLNFSTRHMSSNRESFFMENYVGHNQKTLSGNGDLTFSAQPR